jgi:tRNA A37 threonylcarbamoyladenosine biosynthesis protein TsaE
MQHSNFEHIKHFWPEIAEFAIKAEQYAHSDPESAAVKLRSFVEVLVFELYEELDLYIPDKSNLIDLLRDDDFQNAIDSAIVNKMHAIRQNGNKAAHGIKVSIPTILWLVQEANLIANWLFVTKDKGDESDCPTYVEPSPQESNESILAETLNLKEEVEKQKALLEQKSIELNAARNAEHQAHSELDSLQHEIENRKLESFKIASNKTVETIELHEDVTLENMKIQGVFEEYDLKQGQKDLIDKLGTFLESKDDNVFLLKGYAGTGKTFITKGLTEYLSSVGRNYILAAPTGKASKVIARKTNSPAYTIHKSIYSFKDIEEYSEEGIGGTQTFKFFAQIAVNELSVDTVYIIDESSMIANVYQEAEFFRFGSGYLLKDLFKFINLDHNAHNKKIIFIGDDAQLPPVGMKSSPALDPKYLLKHFNVSPVVHELTEVVRQAEGSGVMQNAINLRKSLVAGVFNKLDFDTNYDDVESVKPQYLMEKYLESCNGKINAESIIIAHSNASVSDYNKSIREHFFPNSTEIAAGDKVMAITNNDKYGLFISNGDFGLVKQVSDHSEVRTITLKDKNKETGKVESREVPLQFRDILVGFKDIHDEAHFFECKIIESLLYSEKPKLESDENKALYVDFCIRNVKLKPGSKEFKDTLREDPYFNAMKLKFGYAITCHKAQGSEWNNVFVNCKTHQDTLSADYFKWLYTAITRTQTKLFTISEPRLNIISKMKFPERPKPLVAKSTNGVPVISNTDENIETDNITGLDRTDAFRVKLFSEVQSILTKYQYKVVEATAKPYREQYVFSINDDCYRVDITYSGKNKITNIMLPNTCEVTNKVKEILMPLKGMVIFSDEPSPEVKIDENAFSEQFLNDFYQTIKGTLDPFGITIHKIEHNDWHERYSFMREDERATIDCYYNGKKQFGSVNIYKNGCSDLDFANEILDILASEF